MTGPLGKTPPFPDYISGSGGCERSMTRSGNGRRLNLAWHEPPSSSLFNHREEPLSLPGIPETDEVLRADYASFRREDCRQLVLGRF
jgi:hypothetical protein